MRVVSFCSLCFFPFLCFCSGVTKSEKVLDLVLEPGEGIQARTPSGTIVIEAGKQLKRYYTWSGETRSVNLWPRKKKRNGGLGAYYPGVGEHWKNHNGVTRGVIQEATINFSSKEEALNWINRPWHKKSGAVYNNDGIFILFTNVSERKQINVDLFQIMINHRLPSTLPGATDQYIEMKKRAQ